METLLFVAALGLVAGVLASVWQLRARVQRQLRLLAELSSLNILQDRMQALAEMVQQVDAPRLRRELERIHDELAELREELRRLADQAARPMVTVPFVAAEPSRAERVRALVRHHLREEGYGSIRLLASDPELEGDDVTIRVEAVRHGLRVLGTVTVQDGAVRDVSLDPNYSLFP